MCHRRGEINGEDEWEAEFISTSAGIVFASVSGGVRPTPGLLFTLPLFLHRIKETICLINARVFNLRALFKSMHKCPHHYNRDIDLLRSPLCAAEM